MYKILPMTWGHLKSGLGCFTGIWHAIVKDTVEGIYHGVPIGLRESKITAQKREGFGTQILPRVMRREQGCRRVARPEFVSFSVSGLLG